MAQLHISLEVGGHRYQMQQPGHNIAIPLHFNGPQPNTYGVAIATAQAYESGGWVGDTLRGGSCNFETYAFTPHCNGTHTECIGHIVDERVRVHERLHESLLPATLISVVPMLANFTEDSYDPPLHSQDLVIDRAMLEAALEGSDPAFHTAICIRTLPNALSKMARDYMQEAPAFFTLEGMAYLAGLGVQHLLVDMPSVDRLFDEGKLSNHHTYWGLENGRHSLGQDAPSAQTITEMIYVPSEIADGKYLLNLQIAPFMADAAPSRPVLYALNPA
jgi:arylformamidase